MLVELSINDVTHTNFGPGGPLEQDTALKDTYFPFNSLYTSKPDKSLKNQFFSK